MRRIEAVTGAGAIAYLDEREHMLTEAARLLTTSPDDIVDKLKQLFDKHKKLERELESLKAKAAGSALEDVLARAIDIKGVKLVAARVDGLDAKSLRDGVDQAKLKLGDAIVLLASGIEGKVALVAGVAGSAMGRVKAGELLTHVASQIGGKGGGRPDMAQGGGEDSPKLAIALDSVGQWVRDRL